MVMKIIYNDNHSEELTDVSGRLHALSFRGTGLVRDRRAGSTERRTSAASAPPRLERAAGGRVGEVLHTPGCCCDCGGGDGNAASGNMGCACAGCAAQSAALSASCSTGAQWDCHTGLSSRRCAGSPSSPAGTGPGLSPGSDEVEKDAGDPDPIAAEANGYVGFS
eukprot:jgi/Tetstr1/461182/TSEL_006319.t1